HQEGDHLVRAVLLDLIAKGQSAAIIQAKVNQHHVITVAMPDGCRLVKVADSDHLNAMQGHDFLAQRTSFRIGIHDKGAPLERDRISAEVRRCYHLAPLILMYGRLWAGLHSSSTWRRREWNRSIPAELRSLLCRFPFQRT